MSEEKRRLTKEERADIRRITEADFRFHDKHGKGSIVWHGLNRFMRTLDDLDAADEEITTLNNDVERFANENAARFYENDALKRQIIDRDEEIERLRAALLRLSAILDFDEPLADTSVAMTFDDTSEINAAFKQASEALDGEND